MVCVGLVVKALYGFTSPAKFIFIGGPFIGVSSKVSLKTSGNSLFRSVAAKSYVDSVWLHAVCHREGREDDSKVLKVWPAHQDVIPDGLENQCMSSKTVNVDVNNATTA